MLVAICTELPNLNTTMRTLIVAALLRTACYMFDRDDMGRQVLTLCCKDGVVLHHSMFAYDDRGGTIQDWKYYFNVIFYLLN